MAAESRKGGWWPRPRAGAARAPHPTGVPSEGDTQGLVQETEPTAMGRVTYGHGQGDLLRESDPEHRGGLLPRPAPSSEWRLATVCVCVCVGLWGPLALQSSSMSF